MRAVRSTINTAGLNFYNSKDIDESEIILKAIKDVNLPKFMNHDLKLFNLIIEDLFPNISSNIHINTNIKYLESFIEKTSIIHNIYINDE